MHATLGKQDFEDAHALFFDTPPARPAAATTATSAAPLQRSVYGVDRRPNWGGILAIAALHLLALVALVKLDVIPMPKPKPAPLVVDLIAEPAPPAVVERPKPEPTIERPVESPVVAPPPIVQSVAVAPPPVMTSPAPPPPRPAPVAPPAAGPVSMANLEERMIEGEPPRYPIESRRKKEQGTVVLRLLIGTDGRVAQVTVAESSGFDRLDRAALEAARRWRWQPMLRDGVPVEVRGLMPIPFILRG
ncbi:MAG: energy transducer TonB [Pseudomonadota bacterium]